MRAMIFALCVVAIAAHAPPRIELNLQSAYKLLTPIANRPHSLGFKQPDGTPVTSRQDWTEKCPADKTLYTAEYQKEHCPFPVAQAFDHNDLAVTVTTRVYRMDLDGEAFGGCEPKTFEGCEVQSIDFTQRSTYLFFYDAQDDAGNYAEQVVFALILDDTTPPVYTASSGQGCDESNSVQAASSWTLSTGCILSAADNMDGDMTEDIKWTVTDVANGPLCTDCSLADASTALSTDSMGKYLVTASVHDHAGFYGHNSKDNIATKSIAVVIGDSTPPWIVMEGSSPQKWECRDVYEENIHDERATGHDLLDDHLGIPVVVTTDSSDFLDSTGYNTVDTYNIVYTATDSNENAAAPATRVIDVVDTTAPSIQLVGSNQVVCQSNETRSQLTSDNYGGTHQAWQRDVTGASSKTAHSVHGGLICEDEGVIISDSCDTDIDGDGSFIDGDYQPLEVTWDRTFNEEVLGDYIRTYRVTDRSGNTAFVTRRFVVADEEAPSIIVQGDEVSTFEATRDSEYTDQGATCSDFVDGPLSHAVEVSGHVVNMRKPGTYTIRYDCQDLSGNQAPYAVRSVIIEDTSCPEITLLGAEMNFVEAGFPYVDAGATATDTLLGDLTSSIMTDGDTVDTSTVFYAKTSCQEIFAGWPQSHSAPNDGYYYITTGSSDNYERTLVWCSFPTGAYDTIAHTYFAYISDGGADAPENELLQYSAECSDPYAGCTSTASACDSYGMKLAVRPAAGWSQQTKDHFSNAALYSDGQDANEMYQMLLGESVAGAPYYTSNDWQTRVYLCSTNDEHRTANEAAEAALKAAAVQVGHRVGDNLEHSEISRAEAGKYVIYYYLNAEGLDTNPSTCDYNTSRTVIVKDTLPPVISLHLQNPSSPSLMAEQATTVTSQGWVFGAIAAALTGVALYAHSFSTKRPTAVVSVPV